MWPLFYRLVWLICVSGKNLSIKLKFFYFSDSVIGFLQWNDSFLEGELSLKQKCCYLLWYFTTLNAADFLSYFWFYDNVLIHSTDSYPHSHYERVVV
jgi:hypothetical protein